MRSEISIVDNPFIENNEVFFDAEREELKIKKNYIKWYIEGMYE